MNAFQKQFSARGHLAPPGPYFGPKLFWQNQRQLWARGRRTLIFCQRCSAAKRPSWRPEGPSAIGPKIGFSKNIFGSNDAGATLVLIRGPRASFGGDLGPFWRNLNPKKSIFLRPIFNTNMFEPPGADRHPILGHFFKNSTIFEKCHIN